MLPCPHCELDMEDAATRVYYNDHPGVIFEMGCPWCNRAVSILLDADGNFSTDKSEWWMT